MARTVEYAMLDEAACQELRAVTDRLSGREVRIFTAGMMLMHNASEISDATVLVITQLLRTALEETAGQSG
jgi:hypothetical protein